MAEIPSGSVDCEVVYSTQAGQVTRLICQVEQGASLLAAIQASGIARTHPEIDLERMRIGIFGRLRQLQDTVRSGDRIEIYRSLRIDPKSARRLRAQKKNRS